MVRVTVYLLSMYNYSGSDWYLSRPEVSATIYEKSWNIYTTWQRKDRILAYFGNVLLRLSNREKQLATSSKQLINF